MIQQAIEENLAVARKDEEDKEFDDIGYWKDEDSPPTPAIVTRTTMLNIDLQAADAEQLIIDFCIGNTDVDRILQESDSEQLLNNKVKGLKASIKVGVDLTHT